MSEQNLRLWSSVDKTDSQYIKPVTKNGYTYSSITAVSQFKQATKEFGIQGIKWGIVKGSEEFSHETYGDTVLLTYDAWMYFYYEGEKGEIPIHAQEKACYITNSGKGYLLVDDEARKKVVTNAMTKGLSGLGFNADVFMGMFENSDYREMVEAEFRLINSENEEKEKEDMFKEFGEWLLGQCETIEKAPNSTAVKLMVDGCEKTLRDKLKVLKSSNEKLEHSIKKLYSAGNIANEKIEAKIKANKQNGAKKNES